MNDNDKDVAVTALTQDTERKAYSPPEVTPLGKIEVVTQSNFASQIPF